MKVLRLGRAENKSGQREETTEDPAADDQSCGISLAPEVARANRIAHREVAIEGKCDQQPN